MREWKGGLGSAESYIALVMLWPCFPDVTPMFRHLSGFKLLQALASGMTGP